MSGIYLDTSVVVPLFLPDALGERARAFFATEPFGPIVSDWTATEFASVLGIRIRRNLMHVAAARAATTSFDTWAATAADAEVQPVDVRAAGTMLRRFDMNLRTADAIHIAIAQRLNAELATFDTRMAECARALGARVPAI